MKRNGLRIGVVLLVAALVGFWLFNRRPSSPPPQPSVVQEETIPAGGIRVEMTPAIPAPNPESTPPLIGEEILRDYGDPGMTPVNDLKLLGGLLSNMALLVKNVYSQRPMSGNEDWAAVLRGANPAHMRFLPDQHRVFNSEGLLVDRWGTPLFFHPVGQGKFDIRSAGPDRKLWTADDVHRDSDGSFRGPDALNRPGLYDPAPSPAPNPR